MSPVHPVVLAQGCPLRHRGQDQPSHWFASGVVQEWGCGGQKAWHLASTISFTGTHAMSGKCWCSHALNMLDLQKVKSHVCRCCQLASVAGNSNWVDFGDGCLAAGAVAR